ncbi:MAG: gamma carbonic anhydrase family protein [Pseudomonadota bacterium]
MTIRDFQDKSPEIAASAYVDDSALVIGDVTIGDDSSIWPMTVMRGDVHSIKIGKRTNIQDASVCHVTHDGKFSPGGQPLTVGDDVTVGHRVLLHACTVGNLCLIGMAATIMDGALVEDNVILGAGSLVPSGKTLESGYLYVGSPVKRVRELNEKELAFLTYSAEHYSKLRAQHKAEQ